MVEDSTKYHQAVDLYSMVCLLVSTTQSAYKPSKLGYKNVHYVSTEGMGATVNLEDQMVRMYRVF